MNKLLKILTLTGISATLSITSFAIPKINNYCLNIQKNINQLEKTYTKSTSNQTSKNITNKDNTKTTDNIDKLVKNKENFDKIDTSKQDEMEVNQIQNNNLVDNKTESLEPNQNDLEIKNTTIIDKLKEQTSDLSNKIKQDLQAEIDIKLNEEDTKNANLNATNKDNNDTNLKSTDRVINSKFELANEIIDNKALDEIEADDNEELIEKSIEENIDKDEIDNKDNSIEDIETYNNLIENLEIIKTRLSETLDIMTAKLSTFDKDFEFSNEEKENLTELLKSISLLADGIKDTSENFICNINGDCNNYENYFQEINQIFKETFLRLENKILTLENALLNIESINNKIEPQYTLYQDPYHKIYGYYYHYSPENENQIQENTPDTLDYNEEDRIIDEEKNQITEKQTKDIKGPDSLNSNPNTKQIIQNDIEDSGNEENNNQTQLENEKNSNISDNSINNPDNIELDNENQNTQTDMNINSAEDPTDKKRFGEINLENNVDTYGPSRKNIDTFFNTALLDENIYNNGYYGYGMPYNNTYNNMAGFAGVNGYAGSNSFNKANLNNNSTIVNNDTASTQGFDSFEQPTEPEKASPKRVKFAKNIDTYSGQTVKGNINSMNGAKITDVIKNKFNNWFKRDKVKPKIEDEQIDKYVEDFVSNPDNNNEIIAEKNDIDSEYSKEENISQIDQDLENNNHNKNIKSDIKKDLNNPARIDFLGSDEEIFKLKKINLPELINNIK